MDVSCPVCTTVFSISPSRLKHGRGKTCSPACGRRLVAERLTKKVVLTCKGCGGAFERAPSRMGFRGKGQYCNKECAYKHKKRGPEAANWRGGRVQGHDAIRKSPEYKTFVRLMLERDGFTCQDCGATGVHLHVHHIQPFALYAEGRMCPNNVKSLCVACHSHIHGRPLRRPRP